MVRIESGAFQMGSTAGSAVEQPVHSVTITRPFWMGKYEVTQAEYQAVVGSNPSYFSGAQRPVERVTWNGAMAYCASLTATESAAGRIPAGYQYRLPTEGEWEYCCRAGTATEWNTGVSLLCGLANFLGCAPNQTTLVGSYAPNAWGLCDMHGNNWEWCLDSWDGSANYSASAASDPYVTVGANRLIRGGSWENGADLCRSSVRYPGNPVWTGYLGVGFRVVLAPILVP
jgi:formylglycine-generating enzyme required for sulfatase activity